MKDLKINVIQLNSSEILEDNIAYCKDILANNTGFDFTIFPECVLCMGSRDEVRKAAKSHEEYLQLYQEHFAPHNVILGGVATKHDDKLFNRMYVFYEDKCIYYDKRYLFSLKTATQTVTEADVYTKGDNEPIKFIYKTWTIGLSICYDLRFNEHFNKLLPCDAIICSAAFLTSTGKSHWLTLLKARAIENQCYMIGCNQTGMNTAKKIQHYGHSIVYDPWGRTVGKLASFIDTLQVTLNKDIIAEIRANLPVFDDIK